jgi:hypothetical protein
MSLARLTQAPLLAAVLACLGTAGPGSANERMRPATGQSGSGVDSLLFSLAVSEARRHGTLTLVVDPTPLPADPSIASIEPLVPDRIRSASEARLSDAALSSRRTRELKSLRVDVASAWEADSCAKARLADLVDKTRKPTRCFDDREVRVALIGIPRPGGPYLPRTVDERSKFGGHVFSVRVIILELYKGASVQSASDFVFRQSGDRWMFVEARVLSVAG